MTPRGDGAPTGFPVNYDDEVTAEQVAKIDKALAPEFAEGEWLTVESETDVK